MVTELTIFLAKIFSIAFLSIALAAIIGKVQYKKIMDDASKNSAVMLLFGYLALIVGALIVNYHNIWDKSWGVIITLFGWMGLLKGISLIIFPKWVAAQSKAVFSGGLGKTIPYLTLILGLILGYFGFFA